MKQKLSNEHTTQFRYDCTQPKKKTNAHLKLSSIVSVIALYFPYTYSRFSSLSVYVNYNNKFERYIYYMRIFLIVVNILHRILYSFWKTTRGYMLKTDCSGFSFLTPIIQFLFFVAVRVCFTMGTPFHMPIYKCIQQFWSNYPFNLKNHFHKIL